MKKKVRHIISSLVLLMVLQSTLAVSNYIDSSRSGIVFVGTILYNDKPIQRYDLIKVEALSLDFNPISGEARYNPDTLPFIIYFEKDSIQHSLDEYNSFKFSYTPIQGQCISYNIEYDVDTMESRHNELVITGFTISDHSFYYPKTDFCINDPIVFPITDIPDDKLDEITIQQIQGLYISGENEIYPSKSEVGIYLIKLLTDVCLKNAQDSLRFSISEEIKVDLPDSLVFCSNEVTDSLQYQNYRFSPLKKPGTGQLQGFPTKSGSYIVSLVEEGMCPSTPDTVYFHFVETKDIVISKEDKCDRVVVSIENNSNIKREYEWSNGSNANIVEFFESEEIIIEAVDKYGCRATSTVDVQVIPFSVESVDYSKVESDCWKEGAITINSIDVNFSRGEHTYTLTNTLNGKKIENLNEVTEGIYQIEVFDVRGCHVTYPEEIIILQKCLSDYPAFSPDADGVEDEYFIPYEGNIKIFNRNGVLLKQLSTPAYWDGKNDSGNSMPMGNYVMVTETGRIVNITIIR